MPFSNTQIDLSNLPTISHIDYKGLDKDYLTARLIRTLFVFIVIGVVAWVVMQLNNQDPDFKEFIVPFRTYFLLAIGVLGIISLLLTYFGFYQKGYAVREKDISYKTGLFWKSKTLIPYNRIQHSEVKQGPFERLFGLSSLRVFTAGGSASDLSINGLKQAEANHLKQFIITKTSADEEE